MYWRARKDAIEVLRIALRLHQPFTSTFGTSIEISIFRGGAVIRRNQHLGCDISLVNRTIAEILNFLGMMDGPRSIRSCSLMTIIGGRGCISISQCSHHRNKVDLP